ncbi:MAG: DUF4230 domain-containing protein [Actinobacteria bacterium]|nr:DUF4230 domain-containing protein [Actinomycetota bacterium]
MSKQNRSRFPSLALGALVIVGLLVAAVTVGIKLFGTPFDTKQVDHSPPPVLLDLRDLSDYHAAQAQFEVTIDQEDDVQWLPSVIAGERVQFVAIGTVDAIVDFKTLPASAIVQSEDRTSVVITLPAPTLSDPLIDHDLSHVMNRDRGLFNRIGGFFSDNPTSETALYEEAEKKMAEAAAATDLLQRAKDNTTSMLYTIFRTLGIDKVDVRFEPAVSG